jgi:4'-phosphopantetheinyl transferase
MCRRGQPLWRTHAVAIAMIDVRHKKFRPAALELWLIDLERSQAGLRSIETDVPRLAPADRARLSRIRCPRERGRRLAAYVALRILLERAAGLAVRGRNFNRSSTGKPRLIGSGPHFSLAHADNLALIAVAVRHEIGVDLETPRTACMVTRYRDRIVSAAGALAERPLSAGDGAFLQAWARLEAFAKMQGDGISRTLTKLGIRGRQRSPGEAAAIARRLRRALGFTVQDIELPSGLYGAVALPRGAPKLPGVMLFPHCRSQIGALVGGGRPQAPLNRRAVDRRSGARQKG